MKNELIGGNVRLRAERADWIIDVIVWLLLILFCFLCLYPFWYVLIASFNEGYDMMLGGVYWWPRKFTTSNYLAFFQDNTWTNALKVSASRTLVGGGVSTFITCLVAYALSRKNLLFGSFYRKLFVLSMYISGGLGCVYTS